MPEDPNKIWKWLSRVADLLSLIPESVRSLIPTAVGFVVTWLFRQFGGTPPLEAFGIGVCVAILLSLPVLLRYLSSSSPPEAVPSEGGTSGSRAHVSALRVRLGASQIVGIFIVALFAHSFYVQSQLQGVRGELNLVRDDMVRYVIPRSLTPEQKATVAKYLSTSTPHALIMKVTSRNEEASSYAVDLRQALENGGWPVGSIIYDDAVPEGVRVDMSEPMQESKPGPVDPFDGLKDRLNPKKKPPDIIREAFEQAGVIVEGGSGSGIGITTTTITIFVGNRRRDKLAIPPL